MRSIARSSEPAARAWSIASGREAMRLEVVGGALVERASLVLASWARR